MYIADFECASFDLLYVLSCTCVCEIYIHLVEYIFAKLNAIYIYLENISCNNIIEKEMYAKIH